MSFIIAAGAAPAFYAEVSLLLIASAVIAYGCFRIGIMPIVSFLIAGALIGPGALGLILDSHNLHIVGRLSV